MGRPIKARFFLRSGPKTPSDVVKYEGVTASINANGTHYSVGATATVAAPDWIDGVRATIALTISTSTGAISAAAITNVGEGYLTAPVVTIVKPASVTLSAALSTATSTISGITTTGIYVGMRMDGAPGMPANNYVTVVGASSVTGTFNFTANTTTNVTFSDQGTGATFTRGLTHVEILPGTIAATAYLSTGSSAVTSAIIKQEGSRSYFVENDQGRGRVKLVATDSLTTGTMKIIATDFGGATYWVTKLTSRKATLVSRSGSPLVPLTEGTNETVATGRAGWTTGPATGTIVTITTNTI